MVSTGPASWFLGLVSEHCRFSLLGETRCGSARLRWLVNGCWALSGFSTGSKRDGSRLCCGLKWRVDLAWAFLTIGDGMVSRRRVAGNGRIARGLVLEEIRWDVTLASRFLLHLLSAATRMSPGRSESLEVERVPKGKSVSGEALLWGDLSYRVADMRRRCRKTSKGKKSSQGDTFLGRSWWDFRKPCSGGKGVFPRHPRCREADHGRIVGRFPLSPFAENVSKGKKPLFGRQFPGEIFLVLVHFGAWMGLSGGEVVQWETFSDGRPWD